MNGTCNEEVNDVSRLVERERDYHLQFHRPRHAGSGHGILECVPRIRARTLKRHKEIPLLTGNNYHESTMFDINLA